MKKLGKASQKMTYPPTPIHSVRFVYALFAALFLCLCSIEAYSQILVFDQAGNERPEVGGEENAWEPIQPFGVQTSSIQPKRLTTPQPTQESTFVAPTAQKTISPSATNSDSNARSSAVFAVPRQAYEQDNSSNAYILASHSSASSLIQQPVYNAPISIASTSPGTIRLVDAIVPFQGGSGSGGGSTPGSNILGGPASANTISPFGDWDPYSFGGNRGSSGSSWFGSSNPSNSDYYDQFQDISKRVARRFVEKVSLDYSFIPRGNKNNGFGIHEVAYQTEFTFPCRLLADHEPLILVPGLDLVWWDGPYGPPDHRRNMPPNAFGAYLEFGAGPRFTKDFAIELWGRAGVYSDFNKITTDAIRLSGRGGVLIGVTQELEAVLGVAYVNRTRVKIFPRVGVIWRPNERVIWKLVFPDPKLTWELTRINNVDWKFYIQGNYGGGCWEIQDTANGETLRIDYNDIRLGLGLEFKNNEFISGYFEFGGAFGRELYSNHEAWCKPQDSIYLKAGFYF